LISRPKTFLWLPGLSLAYERENVLGQTLHLEYNLTYRKLDGVLRFAVTSETGPDVIGYCDADLELLMYNLDIDMHTGLDEYFSIDIGPTVSCISRTFSMDDLGQWSGGTIRRSGLEDRLISYGLGVNGSFNFELPLSAEKEHVYLLSSLKLRYIHALWFDARGRNVDDYYQSFSYSQLHVGVGYSF
jgi:hypothetical protein